MARTRTKDAAADILERVAGGMSLVKACGANNLTHGAFLDACAKDADLADRYARARQSCLEFHAEILIDLCDTPVEGTETTIKADGGVEVKTGDMLGHRKLQIDTRKWLLAKLMPSKYGEKLDLNHSGSISVPVILNTGRK